MPVSVFLPLQDNYLAASVENICQCILQLDTLKRLTRFTGLGPTKSWTNLSEICINANHIRITMVTDHINTPAVYTFEKSKKICEIIHNIMYLDFLISLTERWIIITTSRAWCWAFAIKWFLLNFINFELFIINLKKNNKFFANKKPIKFNYHVFKSVRARRKVSKFQDRV